MKFIFTFWLFLLCFFVKSATITISGSGNWSSTTPNAPWPGGILPNAGDNVVVSGGRTLTVDGNYSITNITVGSVAGTSNSLIISSGFSLTVTNNITIVPPNSGTNNNVLNIGDGYVMCNGLSSSDSNGNTRDCNIVINTGTLDVNGNAALGANTARNAFSFTGGGMFRVNGAFTGGGTISSNLGNVEYYGGAQTVNTLFSSYNNLLLSNSGTKTISTAFITNGNLTLSGSIIMVAPATFTVNGTVSIAGTAQMDCATNTSTANFKGNFLVTSTNVDPFLEGLSLVNLSGNSGTQTISTVLAGGETFYKLSISNTSLANPAVIFQNNITINEDYDHSNGFVDLSGFSLICSGANTSNQTFNLNNGGIISSTSGSSVTINQGTNSLSVDYSGFQIGDNSVGITTNMSSDNSTWINSTFFGSTNFVKTGAANETFGGGNTFNGTCSFSTTASAGRWRMGDDGSGTAGTDTYYNGTFTHNGSSNFIVGCNNSSHFYGTTTLNSSTAGGLYITRLNGTVGSYTATFHGPVVANVSLTGSVYFADATTSYSNVTIFENTIQCNSLASSTGDIQFGTSSSSSVILTNTSQFIAGSILGRTSIYLRKVTQTGNLTQTISGSIPNSKLFCGTSSTTQNIFNGPTSFNLDTINVQYSTFNNDVTFIGNAQHTLNSNIFNGFNNSFTKNGSSNNSCTGGNTFIAGSTNIFTNNGTGYWRLANTTADDYNGDVTFNQLSSGALVPAYATNCTFSGNISTSGTGTAITFCGSSTSGTITIDGNGSQTILGSSSRIPIIRNLVMNTSGGGSLTLNVPLNISSTLLMTSGNIISTSTNSITLTDETVTSNIGNANSFVNGPCYYNVTSNALNSLTFPVGKGTKWRPVILGERNSVATSITYKAEVVNTSARSLGYTLPATVDTVSDINYWDVDRTLTSSGAALPTQSLTGTQSITLYYLDGDEVKDPSNLRIVKNTSAAPTTWFDIGGTGSAAPAGFITSTSAPSVFNSYSRFTLGDAIGGSNPLPIELLSFTAEKNNKAVDVKWETATEINNDYYIVEKSKDGVNFEPLIQINGSGNSLSKLNYSIIDEKPYNGITYYRLKQVDFNGSFSYSKIASVDFNSIKEFSFDIYPNPNKGNNINLAFEGISNQDVLVVVYDVTGKESFSKVLVTSENESSVFVIDPTQTLSSGVYIITATSDQKIYRKKLIVE